MFLICDQLFNELLHYISIIFSLASNLKSYIWLLLNMAIIGKVQITYQGLKKKGRGREKSSGKRNTGYVDNIQETFLILL